MALTFGAIVAAGHTGIWSIYALTAMLGVVLAVDRPAMQAILFQLVGPDLLPSAVAANSTINSMSRLIGPAIAGVLIATVGIGTCFFVNAASYFVVIAALVGLRTNELVDRPLAGRTKGKLCEGFAYVRSQPDVRRTLLVMAVVGTVALNFQTTIPSMIRFEFDLGAGSIGIAMSVSAIGSILGGIYIAGVTPHPRRTLAIAIALVAFASTLVAFASTLLALALAPSFWTFVAISIPLGFASASFQSVNTVVLHHATEPSMQGKVMALHQMAWFGSTPIGALFMGWIIHVSSACAVRPRSARLAHQRSSATIERRCGNRFGGNHVYGRVRRCSADVGASPLGSRDSLPQGTRRRRLVTSIMLPTMMASAAAKLVATARYVPPVAGRGTSAGIVGDGTAVVGVVAAMVVGVVAAMVVGVAVGVVVVVVDRAPAVQLAPLMVLVSKVTAPLRASRRPVTVAPAAAEMDVKANTVPTNTEFVASVAELVTCQKTLHGLPPLIIATVLVDAVMRVLAVLNTKTAFGSPWASSVSVPVSPRVAPVYTPGRRVCPPRSAVTVAVGERPAASL